MKITVITPFYKGEKYIERYVDCMLDNEANLKSEGHELRIILVNDNPSGPAIPIDNNEKDGFIKFIVNDENRGIHFSRVAGLEEVSDDTDYIMFLDQDDTLEKDALLTMLNHAKANNLPDVVVSNAKLEQADGSRLLWYRNDYHKSLIGDLNTYVKVGIQIISPGQCLIKPDSIPDFWKENILENNGADDYFLWLLMLAQNKTFSYCDEPLYEHHYTAVNLSADTTVTDTSSFEFMEYLGDCEFFPQEALFSLHEMVSYKSQFRTSKTLGKIQCSLAYLNLFTENLKFKKKTGTKLGFNR